jgi:hypothetical protein
MTDTPATVLRNAAEYIWRHGWTQEQFYDRETESGEFFPPACAVGAIRLAVFGEPVDLMYDADDPDTKPEVLAMADEVHEAQHALCARLRSDYTRDDCASMDTIAVWNDDPRRTLGDVIHTLNLAADDWEQRSTKSRLPFLIVDAADLDPATVLRCAGGYLFTCGYTRKAFYDRDATAELPPADVIGAIRAVVWHKPVSGINESGQDRIPMSDELIRSKAVEEAQHLLCAHVKPDYERGRFSPMAVIWDWCDAIDHDLATILMTFIAAADNHPIDRYAANYVAHMLDSAVGR